MPGRVFWYFGLYSVGDGKSLEGLSKGDDPNLSLRKDHSEALAWRCIKESEWDWKTSGAFSVIQARHERERKSA